MTVKRIKLCILQTYPRMIVQSSRRVSATAAIS